MDKQQKTKIALSVLVVIMAIVWGPIIFGSGSDGEKDTDHSNRVEKDTSINLASLSIAGGPRKSKTAYTEWGQNPFMLKRAPKALYIEGIMWDANNPQAIINGDMFGVGAVVEGKTIVEIKPNSVILKGEDGKEFELKY